MASIQSLGVGSGLLTTELLENIIAAEREATDLRLDAEQAAAEARLSAFGAVRSALDGVKSAASALKTSTSFSAFTTSSSDDGVATASTSSLANPGTYQIEVEQIARAQVLATGAYESLDTVIGTGSLNIRFGTTTFAGQDYDGFAVNEDAPGGSIEIDAGNRTLAGIRDAINAAGVGVRAGVIDDGSGFRLVLTAEASGAANSIEVTVEEGDEAGLSALEFSGAAQGLTQTVAAQDAILEVDGIRVSRDSNRIAGVVQGLTLNANSARPGSPVTINIERDLDAAAERVQTFVDSYNEFKDLLGELTAFDPESSQGGVLLGDSTLRGAAGQLSRALASTIENPFSDELRALVDIGISTDRSFRLTFDRSLFESRAGNIDALASVFAANGNTSDSQVSFISSQPFTQTGDYDLTVSRIAQQGLVRGLGVANLAVDGVTIDGANDQLRVAVNGTSSGEITLTQGSYTAIEFATELQLAINGDANLRAAGRSVEVRFDADRERFEIVSGTYGTRSTVAITGLDPSIDAGDLATAVTSFGLRLDDGVATQGRDLQVQLGGYTATGNGQVALIGRSNLAAAPGFLSGDSTAALRSGALTVDATNKTFSVVVDGVGSGSIELTEGAYDDLDALATELTTQINGDGLLSAAQVGVDVFYDALNERFEIISRSSGDASTVEINAADAAFTADLGLAVALGFTGTAASPPGRDVAVGGLQFGIFGGETGARGRIDFTRGVGDRIDALLDGLLSTGGSLSRREDALRESLADIGEERTRFDQRIAAQELRLRNQFAVSDALIAQLNSTSDFLSSQLGLLPLNNLNSD